MITDENKIWKVCTEGDCEGKTIKNLGTFRGNIVEIAKALASKSFYQLRFTEITTDKLVYGTLKNSVHFSVNAANRDFLKRELDKAGVKVSDSDFYSAVRLDFSEEEINDSKRIAALSKLSDEEKELLGLN